MPVEPLKPRDVRRVEFSKPPSGRRGYDETEVDLFLDVVEQSLSMLYHEIALLRGEPTAPGGVGARSGGQLALPAGPNGSDGSVVHFHGEPSVAERAILAELDQIKLRLARIESAVETRF